MDSIAITPKQPHMSMTDIMDAWNRVFENGDWNTSIKDISKEEIDMLVDKYIKSIYTPPKSDSVNHPSHYTDGKIEVIDFIEDKKLGYHLGNVIKYIARAGKKEQSGMTKKEKELEDLRKAKWYLERRIEQVEEELQ